jgi:hypothetical protein
MIRNVLLSLSIFVSFHSGAQQFEVGISADCVIYFKMPPFQTYIFDKNGNALQIDFNKGDLVPFKGHFPSHFEQIRECIYPVFETPENKGVVVMFYSNKIDKEFFENRILLYQQFCIENNFILLCICQDFISEKFVDNPFDYAK